MNSASIAQPTALTYSLFELVELVRRGKIRIPKFQRPFRWGKDDVRRLFDSILKGYPIGSLLLWKRPVPADSFRLGALELESPAHSDGLWVVDGQQRLTSLASALVSSEDDHFSIVYDIKNETFARKLVPGRPELIPLPVLFDLQRLLGWLSKHPELAQYAEFAAGITRSIREYKIPAYVVEQEDEAVLRDIFDRMNNYGKRLSRAEIFSALHPNNEGQPGSFERIAQEIDSDLAFGLLDDDTVLRAILARRGGDVTRDIRLEFSAGGKRDFGGEPESEAYRLGAVALRRAVAFLQANGVPHVAFLPYRYLLVVLTRFFAHFPSPGARNAELLGRWFWRATLIGPSVFSGSWTHAMRTLASRIVAGEESRSVQNLLSEPIDKAFTRPDLDRFRTNQADSRVILSALWNLGPRSPLNGERYQQEHLVDVLEAQSTPRDALARFFPPSVKGSGHAAANRYFSLEVFPTNSPAEIFATLSTKASIHAEVLASHALSSDLLESLSAGRDADFLGKRRELLKGILEQFLAQRTGQSLEDTPPLDELLIEDGEEDE